MDMYSNTKIKNPKTDRSLERFSTVWVVGASTGIGRALVDELSAPGRTLFISSRSHSDLTKIALEKSHNETGTSLVPLVLDVADAGKVAQAANKIAGMNGSLDMVIVNAGTCEYLDSHPVDMELVKRVFRTNFEGALNVINSSLPLLKNSSLAQSDRKSKKPLLVIISSSVTYQALPRAGAYGGSKAALRYFVECMKVDLQHENIDVRIVSPGFVKTPLTDKNDFDMPFLLSSQDAAKRIVKGLEGSRFDIRFPFQLVMLFKLVSWLPDRLRFPLVGRLSRQPSITQKSTLK